MNKLSFPLFEIEFTKTLPREIILMLLGGRKAAPEWLAQLDFYDNVWAVDSGVDLCMAAKITPDRLIGDGDSASAEAWAWAKREGAKVYPYESDKDLTDFQLALELLSSEACEKTQGVVLTGAFGGRFDHLFSMFFSFTEWSKKYLPVGIADEREALFLLRGGEGAVIEFHGRPAAVSLIPFADSSGVSIGEVKWPLKKVELERARPYSISNIPGSGNRISASVEKGLVGLYCAWFTGEK